MMVMVVAGMRVQNHQNVSITGGAARHDSARQRQISRVIFFEHFRVKMY